MPVPFQVKSRAFQAFLPDVGLIGMVHARDFPEPLGIPCPQGARDRKLAQIPGVRYTEIEGRILFKNARGLCQHGVDVGNVLEHRVAEPAGKVFRWKWSLRTVGFH
jgi:hypothetical protein